MSGKRVPALMHDELVPPESLEGLSAKDCLWYKGTFDVVQGLRTLGHDVSLLGIGDEIGPLRQALKEYNPHIVFNLLEGFRGLPYLDHNVVSFLELYRTAYTGCNPRGLILARDKALSKKILSYHRISVPTFVVFPFGRKFGRRRVFPFPMIVKSLTDDASAGIAQASIVHSREKLEERVRFIHETFRSDAIAEQYIEGRELYVSIVGNYVLKTLPIWELILDKLPEGSAKIATEKVKWDVQYQERHKIDIGPAKNIDEDVERQLYRISKRIFKILGLSGYARIDFRLAADGKAYFLEANPNPDISHDEELASAAAHADVNYEELLQKIINLGSRQSTHVNG